MFVGFGILNLGFSRLKIKNKYHQQFNKALYKMALIQGCNNELHKIQISTVKTKTIILSYALHSLCSSIVSDVTFSPFCG